MGKEEGDEEEGWEMRSVEYENIVMLFKKKLYDVEMQHKQTSYPRYLIDTISIPKREREK